MDDNKIGFYYNLQEELNTNQAPDGLFADIHRAPPDPLPSPACAPTRWQTPLSNPKLIQDKIIAAQKKKNHTHTQQVLKGNSTIFQNVCAVK